jgi:hypothetical protein
VVSRFASGAATHYAIPPYLVPNGNGDVATIYETELNWPAGAIYSATPFGMPSTATGRRGSRL